MENKTGYLWGALRLGMGWIFFWAFIDKLFGQGFATAPAKAWLAGGSPTLGFLKAGTKGPLADFFQGLAGNPIVDWLFMLGLAVAGITLLLGILIRLGSTVGVVLMILIYLAGFLPPANNPLMDDHVIYALLLVALCLSNSGYWLGLGRWWSRLGVISRHVWLR